MRISCILQYHQRKWCLQNERMSIICVFGVCVCATFINFSVQRAQIHRAHLSNNSRVWEAYTNGMCHTHSVLWRPITRDVFYYRTYQLSTDETRRLWQNCDMKHAWLFDQRNNAHMKCEISSPVHRRYLVVSWISRRFNGCHLNFTNTIQLQLRCVECTLSEPHFIHRSWR